MALHHDIGRAAVSSQGSLIVAVVLLAFIVYVTLQNHLGAYLADLGIGAKAQQAAIAGGAAGGAVGGNGIIGAFGGLGGIGGGGQLGIPGLPSLPSLPNAINN